MNKIKLEIKKEWEYKTELEWKEEYGDSAFLEIFENIVGVDGAIKYYSVWDEDIAAMIIMEENGNVTSINQYQLEGSILQMDKNFDLKEFFNENEDENVMIDYIVENLRNDDYNRHFTNNKAIGKAELVKDLPLEDWEKEDIVELYIFTMKRKTFWEKVKKENEIIKAIKNGEVPKELKDFGTYEIKEHNENDKNLFLKITKTKEQWYIEYSFDDNGEVIIDYWEN